MKLSSADHLFNQALAEHNRRCRKFVANRRCRSELKGKSYRRDKVLGAILSRDLNFRVFSSLPVYVDTYKHEVDWLGQCHKCKCDKHMVTSSSADSMVLNLGDHVICTQCGETGAVETDGGEGCWVAWDEEWQE